MRLAVIADIHSNDLALEAVLDDIAHHAVDQVIHLGDAVIGPINPARVAEMLRNIGAVNIMGNGDRMVLEAGKGHASRSAVFARERLSSSDLDFISKWHFDFANATWRAFHGPPRSDTEYL